MTIYYRTKGFVFKKDDKGEADRVFSVFTEDFGKIEIRARAIRKINSKLRSGIDNFYFSEIEFVQGKNYKTLTDALTVENFFEKDNFEKKEILNKVAGLLDSFINGQEKDKKIFDLIKETFEKFKNSKIEKLEDLYYYFVWNFFSELGYMPEVKKCAKCHEKLNPYRLYFSSIEGGVACAKCCGSDNSAQKINSDIVKILRLILKKEWQTLSKLNVPPISRNLLEKISDDYYSHMLSNHSFL